jgi:hypothetical protein
MPRTQRHPRSPLPLVMVLVLAGVGAAVLTRPDAWPEPLLAALPAPQPQLQPQDFPLDLGREGVLFSQLDAADRAWTPRAEPIPGGGTRYVYKRRAGDPPLNLAQIKALMLDPPSFAMERRAIDALLLELRRVGARVVLGPPRKQGAAGEWEPRRNVLRIRPDVPAKGSREFVRVLNHEAIHVAQSCRRGSLNARPMPLGLSRAVDARALRNLAAPVYADASPQERVLEEEAYANQENLSLGLQLLQAHCRSR